MTNIFISNKEYFSGIPKIKYEGTGSDNPLSFKYYDENKMIGGKSMKEHLRFAVCYWHTFCGTGADPFGPGTQVFEWDKSEDPLTAAQNKMDAAFEFFTKLGTPYYCFHDIDMAPYSPNIIEREKKPPKNGNLCEGTTK
jgi:xylose isomerase